MYYLLEDNRIIKDDKLVMIDVEKNTLDQYILGVWRFQGKIKKKSKNVFDLIDRDDDLLKISVLGFSNVLSAKSINGNFKDMDNILAIYKPNKNGDYIKVWEKENENDR